MSTDEKDRRDEAVDEMRDEPRQPVDLALEAHESHALLELLLLLGRELVHQDHKVEHEPAVEEQDAIGLDGCVGVYACVSASADGHTSRYDRASGWRVTYCHSAQH